MIMMDRSVFKRTMLALERDGRVKETIAMTPTQANRWVKAPVFWLADTPKTDVDAYIRSFMSKVPVGPTKTIPSAQKVAAQQYTDLGLPSGTRTTPRQSLTQTAEASMSPIPKTPLNKREIFLQEPLTAAFLLGWQSGRFLRTAILHKAIIRTMALTKDRSSIVSLQPRIFALPLVFEDITVDAYLCCVSIVKHDDDFEEWARDPANRQLRIKDVPDHLRPPGDFGSAAFRNKLNVLLGTMCDLKVISRLQISTEEDAPIVIQDGPHAGSYAFSKEVSNYYLVHDHAPIYHVAADPSILLGDLRVRTVEDAESFWLTVMEACTIEDMTLLRPLEKHAFDDELGIASHGSELAMNRDAKRLLRQKTRWQHAVRLQPDQRTAINSTIDWKTGLRKFTADTDVDQFAHDNALPLPFVASYLTDLAARAAEAVRTRIIRQQEEDAKQRDRQARAQASLKAKIAERQAQIQADWEAKVKAAAEKLNAPYTEDLLAYVSRRTLQTTRRSENTDEVVENSVRVYVLGQKAKAAQPTAPSRAPFKLRRVATAKPVRRAPSRTGEDCGMRPVTDKSVPARAGGQQRLRYLFTAPDDETLLDAEAILRVRSGKTAGFSRAAIKRDCFPGVSTAVLTKRFKKVLSLPGKEVYFEGLEQAWQNVWAQYVGTPELPDPNPEDITNFDLAGQISFLRRKINKIDIRLNARTGLPAVEANAPELPMNTAQVLERFTAQEKLKPIKASEAGQSSEESRLAQLTMASLMERLAAAPVSGQSLQRSVGEAVLKVGLAAIPKIWPHVVDGDRHSRSRLRSY